MRDYIHDICSIFADKYPDSAAYSGGRSLRIGNWDKRFPEIKGDYEAKNAFLDSVDFLCGQQILQVKWIRFKAGEKLSALYLHDEIKLYDQLGLVLPQHATEYMVQAVAKIEPRKEHTKELKGAILSQKKMLKDLLPEQTQQAVSALTQSLLDIFILIETPKEVCQSHTIRQLSIELYHDSKRIEKILPLTQKLTTKLLECNIPEELGMKRTYPETTCMLQGVLNMTDQKQLYSASRSITLPFVTMSSLSSYTPIHANEHILLLENKESYYTAVQRFHSSERMVLSGFTGFLYLGGYPNSADAKLIQLLAAANVKLSCFCDLDPAGILITEKAESIAGVPIDIYQMDADTYKKYEAFGYPLAASEVRKLQLSSDSRFRELKDILSSRGIGVEQEIIPV